MPRDHDFHPIPPYNLTQGNLRIIFRETPEGVSHWWFFAPSKRARFSTQPIHLVIAEASVSEP